MGEVSSPEISGGPLRSYNVGVAPLDSADITGLLKAWGRGDSGALEQLTPLVYAQLRAQARRHMRNERSGATLQSTGLVHEVYLRLINAQQVDWRDRAHFFALSAQLMRRILVDHARARRAAKRGGLAARVTFDEALVVAAEPQPALVELDDALEALARLDDRKSRVVEMRFFGGLTVEETAAVLNVSVDTVMRDWRFAKAWLEREMGGGADDP